jgi:hypothetical protein
MKKILFTLLFIVAFLAGYTQMSNNGGAITVENGATLVIEGDYTSSSSGTIEIDGTVQLKGKLINNSGGIHSGSTGLLKFNGSLAQEIKGTAITTFYCGVEIDNIAGVSLASVDEIMASLLTLTNGKLTLNAYNLTLAAAGVTGAGTSKFIVTNSTGACKRSVPADGTTDVAFPVGNSTYNPLILKNAGTGTTDTYGVIAKDGKPGSFSGTTHFVNRHWEVTEGTGGGSALTVTGQWAGTDENAPFDRTDCSVGLTTNNGSTVNWTTSGISSGTDPYTRSGSGFTSIGKFMVGDYFYEGIELDLDMFLAGSYSSGSMSLALNSLIPTTDPYGNGIVGATIPATAVDWIEVELRSAPGTVDKSYSFFVDNGGNVLNTNGVVGTKLTGIVKGSYYVALRHRNHLGAMTLNPINFTTGGPSYAFNFTTGSGIWGSDAMQDMGGGVYALWAGDANGDGKVIYQGADNDPTPVGNTVSDDPGNTGNSFTYIVNGYLNTDINMDGQVIYQGAGNDPTPIGNSVSAHPGNTGNSFTYPIIQQLP